MHGKGVSDEFDLMIGGPVWSIDEEFGSPAYILATHHAGGVLNMLRNAIESQDITFPHGWRMRVRVSAEGYSGSYSFAGWDEYEPEYEYSFKRIDDLGKTYFPERE